MKICQLGGPHLYYADRRTDVTKLVLAYHNFMNAPTDCTGAQLDCFPSKFVAVNQQNIERLSVTIRRGNSLKLTYTCTSVVTCHLNR